MQYRLSLLALPLLVYVFGGLEDGALDIAQGTGAAGFLLFRLFAASLRWRSLAVLWWGGGGTAYHMRAIASRICN